MSQVPPTAVAIAGASAAIDTGMLDGTPVKLVFAVPGLNLTHAGFKNGFALPRPCHTVDCVYCIADASLRIGTEELGRCDGFFVGAAVPYSYVAGSNGVEVLEFRGSTCFDIRLLANNPKRRDGRSNE